MPVEMLHKVKSQKQHWVLCVLSRLHSVVLEVATIVLSTVTALASLLVLMEDLRRIVTVYYM